MMVTRTRTAIAGLVAVLGIVLSGCSLTLAALPVPDGQSGPTYPVKIEFSSVLNIPGGAKVLIDGGQVGKLESVSLGERTATATVAIQRAVSLPVETRAELRQGTLLGDLYIALTSPAKSSGRKLRGGDLIPLSQTSPPDNVETVIISLGQLINGGMMAKLQDTLRKTNEALPHDPQELSALASNAVRQIVDMGRSTGTMGRLLDDSAATLKNLADHADTVERALTVGPERFGTMQSVFLVIVDLISDLRFLTKPGGDLLPAPVYRDIKAVVASLDPMVATLSEIDRSLTTNGDLVTRLVAKKLGPFFTGPSEVNIVKAGSPDGRAVALAEFLRAIGMV